MHSTLATEHGDECLVCSSEGKSIEFCTYCIVQMMIQLLHSDMDANK